MKFNRDLWFQELNLKLKVLNKDEDHIYYLIVTGPLKIQVVLPKNSSYKNAINSFFNAQSAKELSPTIPTIYCLDESYINKLPPFRLSKNDLNLIDFESRLSSQTKIINYDEKRKLLKALNTSDQNYLFLCESFDSLPSWEVYSPLKEFIHFIALKNNCWLSHAGSLCKNNKAVLLFGPGGNGKSTTTLTGLNADLQTVGDDYVLIENFNEKFYAHAIYKTIKTYPSELFDLHKSFEKFERQLIERTGKYVYICEEDKESNIFTHSAEIVMNMGLHLNKNLTSNECDNLNFDARYMSLSSIEQIPFWVDKSSKFSEKIYRSLPNYFSNFKEGEASLDKNIEYILNFISSQGYQNDL